MISVIMPIYNGEKYIQSSIEKVLRQEYKDLELILVDDGSTDNSSQICLDFAQKDTRVIYLRKENGGICSARNAALDIAKGEYVSFCDQDDCIADGIYGYLLDHIVGCDYVIAGKRTEHLSSTGDIKDNKVYQYEDYTTEGDDQLVAILLNEKRDSAILHLWNGLYRRNIIEEHKLRFDERFKYGQEDTAFNISYGLYCKNIHTCPFVVYNYYRRDNQSTSTKTNAGTIQDLSVFSEIINYNFEKKYGNHYKNRVYLYLLRFGINIYFKNTRSKVLNISNRIAIWRRIYDCMITSSGGVFPDDFRVKSAYYLFVFLVETTSRCKLYALTITLLDLANLISNKAHAS